jgi:glycosyltransferase involved in cell wall biosynthesis
MTDISVIICSFNRCQSLEKALDSIAKSVLAESTIWEVLIVDNNSVDRTRHVAAAFCSRFPNRFRYIFESQPGKSFALNTGIRESQGGILVFTDDDVTVEPTWLQRLADALSEPNWAGAGGPVVLQWSCPRPRWLPLDIALGPLASFDQGSIAGELSEPPIGANMAYRRTMFTKYGGFRTDLGPSPFGETPRPNEDTEFGRRLIAAGERLFYEPLAVVFHSVPESRLQKTYFLAWWFDKGRADIREIGVPSTKWVVRGIPLYLLRRFVLWTLRWITAVVPSRRFSSRLKLQYVTGTIAECRRRAGKAPRLGQNFTPSKFESSRLLSAAATSSATTPNTPVKPR